MFQSSIKTILKNSFLLVKGDSFLRYLNRTPRVLFWHGVDNRIIPDIEQEICETAIFEQQIDYLRHFYEIISMQEFDKRFHENNFSGYEVVLTFDDGYANNLYVVEPILSQYSLPFTVFISTEHIDKGAYFPTSVNRIITRGSHLRSVDIPSLKLILPLSSQEEKDKATTIISSYMKNSPVDVVRAITSDLIQNVGDDEWTELKEKFKSVRPLNWKEVKILSEKGVTIGSHCMWHICCHERQNHLIVEDQIRNSKLRIQEQLKCDCLYFAYPNGDFTDNSNACVCDEYNMGFTTRMKERIHSNGKLCAIPRMGVPYNISTFKIMLNLYPKK